MLWTLDSEHPDYHRLARWILQSDAPLQHLLLYYSDFAEGDGLQQYKDFLDNLVALDIALHYSSMRRLHKLSLLLTQFSEEGIDRRKPVADATRYALTHTFRRCKAEHVQLQLIWGMVRPGAYFLWTRFGSS